MCINHVFHTLSRTLLTLIQQQILVSLLTLAVCAFNVRSSDKNAFKEVATVDDQLISLSKNIHSYVSTR